MLREVQVKDSMQTLLLGELWFIQATQKLTAG